MKKKPALPEDAEVHVRHFRIVTTAVSGQGGTKVMREMIRYSRSLPTIAPDPCGGRTEVDIVLDGVEFSGVANCSIRDAFSYKVGREIALGRAFKKVQEAGLL